MKWFARFLKADLLGVHLAVNVFVATVVLWLLLRKVADLIPIWTIGSMIASVDPNVKLAYANFRARLINALLGCVVGLLVLIIGGSSEWKLPFALAARALLSAYVVRATVMWRQAPITAALVIASSLEQHSKLSSLEIGFSRVGEVTEFVSAIIGLDEFCLGHSHADKTCANPDSILCRRPSRQGSQSLCRTAPPLTRRPAPGALLLV